MSRENTDFGEFLLYDKLHIVVMNLKPVGNQGREFSFGDKAEALQDGFITIVGYEQLYISFVCEYTEIPDPQVVAIIGRCCPTGTLFFLDIPTFKRVTRNEHLSNAQIEVLKKLGLMRRYQRDRSR